MKSQISVLRDWFIQILEFSLNTEHILKYHFQINCQSLHCFCQKQMTVSLIAFLILTSKISELDKLGAEVSLHWLKNSSLFTDLYQTIKKKKIRFSSKRRVPSEALLKWHLSPQDSCQDSSIKSAKTSSPWPRVMKLCIWHWSYF